jgi:2-polyprenyl-6-methoxyphenol hydroxylase-like FAD-dependent oxidoreductase
MSEVNNAPGVVPVSLPETTDVLIVGGGPVGSALAAELRLRGVSCLIVEKETEIPDTPVRAMYLNMRTLEHFRRWRIADQLRCAATTPREWQFDVTFCTSLTGHELGLYRALAYRESKVGDVAAEPAQSVMQYVANRVLRDRAGELGAVVATGWDCTSITQINEPSVPATR